FRQRHFLPRGVVEHLLEARLGADAHVEARGRHPIGRLKLGAIDQFAADRVLDPEIVRRFALLVLGLFLLQPGAREIRQPVHGGVPPKSRAGRTASPRSSTLRKTRWTVSAGSPPAFSGDISSTKAEPITTASAVLAIAAAASGVRTPKPTAMG